MKIKIQHLIEQPQGNLEVEPLDVVIEGKQVSEVSITEVVDRDKEAETVEKFERMVSIAKRFERELKAQEPHKFISRYIMGTCDLCGKLEDTRVHI